MWSLAIMEQVWGLGLLAAVMGGVLWHYWQHPLHPLQHHPGFWAWPAVFGCAALAVSQWPDAAFWAAGGVFYSLGWVFLLEHTK